MSRRSTLRCRWQCPGQVGCPEQEVADFVTDRAEYSVFLSGKVWEHQLIVMCQEAGSVVSCRS